MLSVSLLPWGSTISETDDSLVRHHNYKWHKGQCLSQAVKHDSIKSHHNTANKDIIQKTLFSPFIIEYAEIVDKSRRP